MAETLRQLGLDKTRARKGAVRPELTPSQIRGLLADVATGGGVPFIDAASQAAQGNYGQAAVSGLLDAPPVKMAGMALAPLIGMVRKAAPMDEALRIAQKNAAKPVSEGGLGLPPDNTPMDRARAMGFGLNQFHYSRAEDPFDGFTINTAGRNTSFLDGVGVHTGTQQAASDRFTQYWKGDKRQPTGFTMPLLVREGNPLLKKSGQEYTESELKRFLTQRAEKAGMKDPSVSRDTQIQLRNALGEKYGAVPYVNKIEGGGELSHFIPDPSRIRSRFAAFDPARINENNLLASLAALGISIPVMRGLLQEEEMQ